MNIRTAVAAAALFLTLTAHGEQPTLEFGSKGVTVGGVKPGTKVAWMALISKRVGYHTEQEIVRGIDVVTPAGRLFVERANADASHSLWTMADVEAGIASNGTPAGYRYTAIPVPIAAASGAATFTVRAPAVEVMYVRPRRGVWSFRANDGSAVDGDGEPDGTVTVPLASMLRYKGNPQPPTTIEPGDVILVIDVRQIRVGRVEVAR